MLAKQTLSDQLIINCLNADYGIMVNWLTLLPLGADMNSSVYKVEAQDSFSYFVKLKQGHQHDISSTILELLHQAGIKEVIPPLKTIHGHSSQRIGDFILIVYPFIEGQNGFSRSLTDEQWLTLGKTMRQVHELAVPSSIQNQIRHETFSPKWREIVRSFYKQIESEPVGDEIALKLLAFMKKNLLAIYQLVDSAEQLSQRLQNESTELVLCHSDIHGGNVLIDESNTMYIVDWDDPIMAPKERDLMFIGGGVGTIWNKPREEALFYKGYGKTELNRTMLAYYRHERIVEDIAEYCHSLLLETAGGNDRHEQLNQFIGMFEPEGVVDRAFGTD